MLVKFAKLSLLFWGIVFILGASGKLQGFEMWLEMQSDGVQMLITGVLVGHFMLTIGMLFDL